MYIYDYYVRCINAVYTDLTGHLFLYTQIGHLFLYTQMIPSARLLKFGDFFFFLAEEEAVSGEQRSKRQYRKDTCAWGAGVSLVLCFYAVIQTFAF